MSKIWQAIYAGTAKEFQAIVTDNKRMSGLQNIVEHKNRYYFLSEFGDRFLPIKKDKFIKIIPQNITTTIYS